MLAYNLYNVAAASLANKGLLGQHSERFQYIRKVEKVQYFMCHKFALVPREINWSVRIGNT